VGTGPQQYVGSLLIPPGRDPVPPTVVGLAAHCDGCLWTLEPACRTPGVTGGLLCPGALGTCPSPQIRMALLLQRRGDAKPWRVGTFCDDPAVTLQPAALDPGVRDRFVALVPPLRPGFEPRGRGIVNVPVLFASGQPATLGRPTFELGGHRITLEATATWSWGFGDGGAVSSRAPGGIWPDQAVNHSYRSAGQFTVSVTTSWSGQFWVDGAGPFVVEGPAPTQRAVLSVLVLPARAELFLQALG